MDRLKPIRITAETLRAHLFSDEEIILDQPGVGLYDGKEKDLTRDDGRLYLTSHRLIYLDSLRPDFRSVALSLSLVRQTEYWTGFLTSSAKITLLLGDLVPPPPSRVNPPTQFRSTTPVGSSDPSSSKTGLQAGSYEDESGVMSWVCRVCGMRNLGSSESKCSMCGVNATKEDMAAVSQASTNPTRTNSRPSTPRFEPSIAPTPPPPRNDSETFPCPSCTFLNHRSMARCEVCDSPLRPSTPSSSAIRPSRPSTPSPSTSAPFVRLSFRQGGEKPFYAALKMALAAGRWDVPGSNGVGRGVRAGKGPSVGIDGIMKGIELNAQETQNGLEDAFKDLDALMLNAKEMIALAQSLNDRLSAQESQSTRPPLPSETDTKLIRSSLVHLGLHPTVVPISILKEEQTAHEELARELGAILNRPKGIMERGIVGLDEVWCAWNRARGICTFNLHPHPYPTPIPTILTTSVFPPALVSPSDLQLVLPLLSHHTHPRIYFRELKSGLAVLHTSHFSTPTFTRRLLDWLDLRQAVAESLGAARAEGREREREGATTLEIAGQEGVALAMAREMVEMVEGEGSVVRDEQGGEGVRWFRNFITSADG